jgi:SAM-dependent methyltransferase
MTSKTDFAEYSNSKIVSLYDSLNTLTVEKDFFLELAKKLKVSKVVDIGAGTGLLTNELAAKGYEVIGVEPFEEMLKIAKKSDYEDRVKWIQGDALKLEKYEADLALMTTHVAQFLLDDQYWLNCLEAICNSLKQGGHLVFETRNPQVQPWFNHKIHSDWPTQTNPRKVSDAEGKQVHWWVTPLEINGNRVIYKLHYFFVESKEEITSINELIFRSKAEITTDLEKTGFIVDKIYGDWDWSEADANSPEFIFVAKKV